MFGRRRAFIRCGKIIVFLTVLNITVVGLLFRFHGIDLSYDAAPKECPIPARFHVSAEPELRNRWKEADAYFLAGGYNLFPGKAAFDPVLLGVCCRNNTFKRVHNRTIPLEFKPIINRTFADVLYRSSYCEEKRENLTGIIRRKVEAAGFTFKAEGLCGGTGYPQKENFTGRGEWFKCGRACTDSKIMLAFERFQAGHDYISEKLFIPLEYGAIPAYFGNGQGILDNILKVNRKAFIDRNDFESDEAYADKIVDLLRHPEELQRMQDEIVFHDVDMAWKRVSFLFPIGQYGEDAAPELYHALRDNPKFSRFVNGSNVRIRPSGENQIELLTHVLNISSIEEIRDPEACVDIEVNGCCYRRR